MKKYIEFISEGKYVTHLTENEFMKLYEKDYKIDMPADKSKIFRQVNSYYSNRGGGESIDYKSITNVYSDYNLVDPKTIDRISPNSKYNYANLLQSNLPSWKDYPKRNKSLICGDYERVSTHWGKGDEMFLVLPKKNAKIGVCPNSDFWTSFQVEIDGMTDLLNTFFEDWKVDEKSWKSLKNAVEKLDIKNIGNLFDGNENKELSVLENFNNFLSPKLNGFNLKTWNNDFSLDYDIECWTDSTSIMIDFQTAKEIGLI